VCDNRTILHGKQDLELDISKENGRIRQPGAGRLSIIETMEGIYEAFLEVIEDHTAGSPMDETIKWTNLSRQYIANKLKDKGFPVSVTVVDKLLKKHKFCRRQAFRRVKKTFQIVMSNLKILNVSIKNIMMPEIQL